MISVADNTMITTTTAQYVNRHGDVLLNLTGGTSVKIFNVIPLPNDKFYKLVAEAKAALLPLTFVDNRTRQEKKYKLILVSDIPDKES